MEVKTDFWTIISRAGPFGELIWLCLFVASIISVWLIVDSYVIIREKKIAPQHVVEAVRGAIEQGDVLKAIQCCEATPTPLSSIIAAGLVNVQEGFEVVQDAVSVAADIEGEKLLSRVTYLSVISNTTPMLGLIGTVQGMILAFHNMGTMEAGRASAKNVGRRTFPTDCGPRPWGLAPGAGRDLLLLFKNRATKIILGMEALTLDVIKALRNVEVVEG